jgi:hypothetical protein
MQTQDNAAWKHCLLRANFVVAFCCGLAWFAANPSRDKAASGRRHLRTCRWRTSECYFRNTNWDAGFVEPVSRESKELKVRKMLQPVDWTFIWLKVYPRTPGVLRRRILEIAQK